MSGLYIKYSKIYDMYWQSHDQLTKLMDSVDEFKESLNRILYCNYFTGKTSDSLKAYLKDVHIPCVNAIKATAQTMLDLMAMYKAGYYQIDNSTNFALCEESIIDAQAKLRKNCEDAFDTRDLLRNTLADISDLWYTNEPCFDEIEYFHHKANTKITDLLTNMNEHEKGHAYAIDQNAQTLITTFQNAVYMILYMSGFDKNTYIPFSAANLKVFDELDSLTETQNNTHENIKELYDKISEHEAELKEKAEDREFKGILSQIFGASSIVLGAVTIAATGGAATPLVLFLEVSSFGVSTAFTVSEMMESSDDIYYGKMGDIDSEAHNPIKEDVFNNNEVAYEATKSFVSIIGGTANGIRGAGSEVTAGVVAREATKSALSEATGFVGGTALEKATVAITGKESLGVPANFFGSLIASKSVEKCFDANFSGDSSTVKDDIPYLDTLDIEDRVRIQGDANSSMTVDVFPYNVLNIDGEGSPYAVLGGTDPDLSSYKLKSDISEGTTDWSWSSGDPVTFSFPNSNFLSDFEPSWHTSPSFIGPMPAT